jgi:hypothetical protein
MLSDAFGAKKCRGSAEEVPRSAEEVPRKCRGVPRSAEEAYKNQQNTDLRKKVLKTLKSIKTQQKCYETHK